MSIELHHLQAALSLRPAERITEPVGKQASVAAVVLPSLELLFIRRSEHPGDPWSGHVAFPGGKQDPEDATPRAAAIRETQEEVGLDLSSATFLGPLDEIATFNQLPRMVIRPFVFALDAPPVLAPNEEVRSTHPLALTHLLSGHGRGEFTLKWGGRNVQLPCVDFDGVRLWGLTLQVVDGLLNRIDGRGVGLARPRQ